MIVRTTMQPGRPFEVDAAEAADLARQGLLLPSDPEPAPPAPAATPVPPSVPAVQPDRDQEQSA